MIWHKQILDLSGMPDDVTVTLIGQYDIEGANLIEIYLAVEKADKFHKLLLYTHNPSMLSREEPSKEDILAKYVAKVKKYAQRCKTYDDIKNKLS